MRRNTDDYEIDIIDGGSFPPFYVLYFKKLLRRERFQMFRLHIFVFDIGKPGNDDIDYDQTDHP